MRPLKPWQGYLFAAASTGLTLWLRVLLHDAVAGEPMLVILTVPIMLSAYLGGLGPGLVATAVSLLGASYFILPPTGSFAVASSTERWQQFFMLVAGVVISATNEALHRARERATLALTEHARAENALRASEERYRALVEWSPEPVTVHRNGDIVFVNPAAVALFGAASAEELLGTKMLDRVHPDHRADAITRMRAALERGSTAPPIEALALRVDGSTVTVEVQGSPIHYDGAPALLASMRDISQRKAHEHEIERLSRLYGALSEINQAIIRLPRREELFNAVCKALVEHGRFRIASIGWHDAAAHEVAPVASCGDEVGLLKSVRVYTDGRQQPRGPTSIAFLEKRPYVCNDLLSDPVTAPWRDVISAAGLGSSVALPIRAGGETCGVLTVLAGEPNAFRDRELSLMIEAVEDISFALDNLERENQRQRASADAEDLRVALDEHALVAITDSRGKITFANDKFCEVSGYAREELLGKDHRIINSKYHDKAFIRDLWETIQSGRVWHGELRNRAKDGSLYWVDTTIVPFLNSDGVPRQYMAIRALITARKEAEIALREAMERARQYLDTAQVMLLALDVHGRVVMANRYACTTLGWTEEELVGRDFIDTCLPPNVRALARAGLANGGEGLGSSVSHDVVVTKSGQERSVDWRSTPLLDSEGRLVSTLSSGTDLTDRQRAVEALRNAEERMRFALESAKVGIWDMDYATGVLKWSPTAEEHHGVAPGTFEGTFDAFVSRIDPADRTATLEIVGAAIRDGRDFTIAYRTHGSDGSTRWLSGAGRVLLGANGEPLRGIGITQDVTERRNLEEQFHHAQKMEAIGRLAGGVAHDFNNLLTVILGYVQLLLTDLEPADQRATDLMEVQRAGTAAAGLTRQLLAFSRRQIIEPTLIDLNQVVTEMRGMLGRLISEDVKIVLVLDEDLSAITADRAQLEQVIMNLAVNARDAMRTGGTLTIETTMDDIDVEYARTHLNAAPGRYVRLTVSDTGTGMPPEVVARLFEPFFTTKAPGHGTGLGLATVHGIVSRMGGSVNVYTEVGIGTSFKVYFPVGAAEATTPRSTPISVPLSVRARTILIVEDADGLRELTRRMLDRQGFKVLTAATPDEAIQQLDAHPNVDLLLTDVVMPEMSGPELSRVLSTRKPGLRVLFMSGYTDDAIVQHGVLNPGVALVNKPFTAEGLARKIRDVLEAA